MIFFNLYYLALSLLHLWLSFSVVMPASFHQMKSKSAIKYSTI